MRPRGSVISQLLIAFCVFAVLIGAAAVAGALAVTRQDAAARQVTGRYSVMQQAESALVDDFGSADSAVLLYTATGQRSYLVLLPVARLDFEGDLDTLRSNATPGLRGLIALQERSAAGWFALTHKIIAVRPRTAAARALIARSSSLAANFTAAGNAIAQRLNGTIGRLTATSSQALGTGLAWSALALAVAVVLVLAAALSTMYTVTRPLRGITATVRRLTSGDHAARAPLRGTAEVREVAESINTQADESDRLRSREAETNRLRAMAREAGLRIREHLAAEEVLSAAQQELERIVDAEVIYLRLIEDESMGSVFGREPEWFDSGDELRRRLTPRTMASLRERFRVQGSHAIDDVQGEQGDQLPPEVRESLRRGGVKSHLLTPFGVGNDLLGIIVVQRLAVCRRWTSAEIDTVESIAADLGRGLHHARQYEAENRLVADLKALDRAKSGFFATVSHELRAPLTTIEGYVEMFGDGEAGEVTAGQRQMLDMIDRSTVRLRNLIEDLFTLAKLESGTFTTVMRPQDIGEVVTGAADALRPAVAAGGLTLTCDIPNEELVVDGDASQLDRLLINLLSNAVKFTPQGGHVEVSALPEGGSAVVRVADTGIGIPARDQKELFTRFFRASNATDRSIPGTGLGLAIVRMIVAGHGGDVELESEEGAGTVVTVRLPLLTRVRPEPVRP
jgi:two-component system, OmpR family, phosphate regulon sensor histidine kinase PhoR